MSKHKTLIKKIENAKQALHNVQRTIYNILSDYEDREYFSNEIIDLMGNSGVDIDCSMEGLDHVIDKLKSSK